MVLPYDEAGTGAAVVLLHAGVADRSMWAEHLEPLARAGRRVVAPDLPSFGEAPTVAGEQAPWRDVLETMDALSIERAALLGNSFGGAVALRVAAAAPDRVSRLVLVSAPAPGLDPSAELQAIWEAEEEALERGDVEAALAAVVEAWTQADAPQELRDRVATMQRRAFEQGEPPDATEAPDPLSEDPRGLARIEVPVLVAAGERDLRDFRDGAEAMAQALPHAELAVIPGAGHLAPLEAPEAFRALALRFLDRRG